MSGTASTEAAARARRVVFVCDAGGHLMEAVEIARTHFAGCEQRWHTADTPMSRSLLAGRTVSFSKRRVVPARADLAARELVAALRLMRRMDVDTVVSTGSAYAFPWLIAARILRKQAIFVESAARLSTQSKVGSLVARVPGVHRATQDPFRLDGWDVWPNVMVTALDGFEPRVAPSDGPPRVLVTVGTFEFPFQRLIDRVDKICPDEWDVTMQHGTATPPIRFDTAPTMAYEDVRAACREVDVVIGHAGVGTVLTAAAAGVQLILVPRRHEHGEMVDDHQTELIAFLDRDDDITTIDDVDDLTAELVEAHVARARGAVVR
jgi:UDP-N-acetylglucosamine transferase subunit ALG13